jgi:nitrate reductase gamma subunit
MNLRRLSILQWVGLGLGGTVWFAQHIVGYGITEARCDAVGPGWGIQHDLWQAVLMASAAVLVVAAEAAAITVLWRTRTVSYEDGPPPGRIRFLAIAAATANVIFLLIILLDGLAAIFSVACRQA